MTAAHFVAVSLLLLCSSLGAESAKAEAQLEPVFASGRLPASFGYACILPGGKVVLLVDKERGRGVYVDLDAWIADPKQRGHDIDLLQEAFSLGTPVDDVVVTEDGRFALLVSVDAASPMLWRVELHPNAPPSTSIAPLLLSRSLISQEGFALAVTPGGHSVVAPIGGKALASVKVEPFPTDGTAVSVFPLSHAIADVKPVPGLEMVFVSRSGAPGIVGVDTETGTESILLDPPQTRDASRPFVLAVSDLSVKGDEMSVPVAILVDENAGLLSLYDFNDEFRTLDFVTRAGIDAHPKSLRESVANQGSTLLLAASRGSKVILVADRHYQKIYFFSRDERTIHLLNTKSEGSVVSMDLSSDGRRAVLLTDGGSSLVVVDRSDISTVASRDGFDRNVQTAQKQLVNLGFLRGAIDGMLGRSTEEALRRFQASQRLDPTGRLDEKGVVLAALNDERQARLKIMSAEFERFFDQQGIRRFKAREFLVPAEQGTCKDDDWLPPRAKWCNVVKVATVLDRLRDSIKAPILIKHAYRSTEFVTGCIGESTANAYSDFRAVDFSVKGVAPALVVERLLGMRDDGQFDGHVADRSGLVHLEFSYSRDLWAYLGLVTKDGSFSSLFFDLQKVPRIGDRIKLAENRMIRLRASKPLLQNGRWAFGEPLSFLDQSRGLLVNGIEALEYPSGETRFWVSGQVVLGTSAAPTEGNWFVVVGSYSDKERASAYAALVRLKQPSFPVSVFRGANKSYAVTVGNGLDASEAKARVDEAKCLDLAEDVYMWAANDWERIE